MNTKTLLPEYVRNARGYLKIEEREKLFELAGNVPDDGLILNVGIEYGASLVCLRAGNESAFLFGMEINDSKLVPLPDEMELRFELMHGDSQKFIAEWFTRIDLLFLDGDHGYRGVTLDTQYINYLKRNGVVMFHDCYDWEEPDKTHRLVPGVMAAVDDWYKSVDKSAWIEHDKVGTSRLFQRIK